MLAAVALFGPALGNISLNYLPPLVVADLVARIASGATITPGLMVPHVAAFAGALLAGEALLRVAIHCINRFESGGMARLYVAGVEELLAKDAAFFHENFAGALTNACSGSRRSSRTSSTCSPSGSWRARCRWCSRRSCSGSSTRCWSPSCSG